MAEQKGGGNKKKNDDDSSSQNRSKVSIPIIKNLKRR